MSAAERPERHLKAVEDEPDFILVHPDTGERVGLLSDYVQALRDQIEGLETDVRAWRTRFGNLKRDKGAEARRHERFPEAKELFDYWRERTGHKRAGWTPERFFLLLPFLERDGLDLCKQAVDGLAWKPYEKEIAPGYVERYDDLDNAFGKRKTFERMVNRGHVWRRQQQQESAGGVEPQQNLLG